MSGLPDDVVRHRHQMLRELLDALGWPDVARPESSSRLWTSALTEVRLLRDAAETVRRLLQQETHQGAGADTCTVDCPPGLHTHGRRGRR